MARPDCDSVTVQERSQIVRMHCIGMEGQDAAPFFCVTGAKHFQLLFKLLEGFESITS